MGLFLSSFTNKIDKKGRVSVPAPYRNLLSHQSFVGIIAYGSFINPCIEACSMERIEQLYRTIDTLDPFSAERDAFTTTILGSSQQLPFDNEGRVILPPALMENAGLTDRALFVGKGHTFEIWNPEQFAVYAEEARKSALAKRNTLRATTADFLQKGGN